MKKIRKKKLARNQNAKNHYSQRAAKKNGIGCARATVVKVLDHFIFPARFCYVRGDCFNTPIN